MDSFLKPLEQHNLLKFIGMNRKYNPNHVKAFYYNLKVTSIGLESVFCNQVIKFTLDDFKHHFGLDSKGNEMYILNSSDFDRTEFVNSISKFVFIDHLNLTDFHISQVKFEMRILHWIVVKFLYRKPYN